MNADKLTPSEIAQLRQLLEDRRALNAQIAEAFGPSAVARPIPKPDRLH